MARSQTGKRTISPKDVGELRSRLRGALLAPNDPGYDQARRIWNATFDRRPALIAQCSGAADVMRAVSFAREHDVVLAVRGGGHNIAGNSMCEGGLVIDLSALRSVRVDPRRRRAHVAPGATLGDVDHETQAFGLATPLGINSTTGVAGLTLGGGFGWLSRKYGLTVDSLRSADVVAADGTMLRADAEENSDLFWGIRGGGGNLGVVTSFEFQLYPVGPEVMAGLIVFPLDQARAVLERYREFVPHMPEDLNVWCILRKAPPFPFLPAEAQGKEIVALAVFYAGSVEEGLKAAAPLRGFGASIGEHLGGQPYTAWQQALDPLLAPGARNYWKTHNFTSLSDGAIDTVLQFAGRLPSTQCEVFIGLLGGKVKQVSPTATAYAHRDAEFVMNVHARWERPTDDNACVSWAREFFSSAAPHATGGAYINFLTEDETDRLQQAYGPNYARLVELKNKYDPHNLFCMNQNIKPTV